MGREKITLTGTQETMLATLYGKALDSRSPNSILRDHEADQAIQRIDYDFGKTGIKATSAAGATLHWGIDDPHEIEGWHDGLKCLALRSVDMPGLDKLPTSGRLAMWVLARTPGFRDIGRILRYRFCWNEACKIVGPR
ncbi:MAG: hypothetical protein ACRDTE_20080 [Pseudonocardiaceae bacterium]